MPKTGEITAVYYNVLGGAVGSQWYQLVTIPPSVALNTLLALAVEWKNTHDENLSGHIAVVVTKPDGTTQALTPSAIGGQDTEIAEDVSLAVVFNAITLDQAGTYTAVATLTETDETDVLDTLSFSVALVEAAAATSAIDMGELISAIIVVGMMGLMMKMVK